MTNQDANTQLFELASAICEASNNATLPITAERKTISFALNHDNLRFVIEEESGESFSVDFHVSGTVLTHAVSTEESKRVLFSISIASLILQEMQKMSEGFDYKSAVNAITGVSSEESEVATAKLIDGELTMTISISPILASEQAESEDTDD